LATVVVVVKQLQLDLAEQVVVEAVVNLLQPSLVDQVEALQLLFLLGLVT
jgi:hypothetical protein